MDLGLVDVNDDSALFVKSSDRPTPRPHLVLPERSARRPSSLYASPSLQDMEERQSRNKPTRLSSPRLSRSQTLPRFYPRSPVRDKTLGSLDASLAADVVSRLRRWIICVLVVNFDLDLGPVIDGVCPSFPLSASERENICFSSFPDSFRHEEGSEAHTFRIRESLPNKIDDEEFDYDGRRAIPTQDGFLYGFSHFSRRRDESSIRGYDQRSVIVLTHNPWPALFTELVNRLGPMYLAHGGPMLESACHNIASWPPPTAGDTLELGFLGYVLNVELPGNFDQQQSTDTRYFREKFDPQLHILASTAPLTPSPLCLFAASISHIWSIWECVLLYEPLLIFGQSPAMTSQAVWWLLDVLRPIPFAGDFRPYFTIHDKDYHSLVNKNQPKAGLLLGVTNPLFENVCKHWPHKLSLGRVVDSSTRTSVAKKAIIATPPPGWQTRTHNRYISKDRELLKRLESAIKGGGAIDADGKIALLLRRHFTTRAVQFLVPLNRYLNTLIPTPSTSTSNNSSSPSLTNSTQRRSPQSLKAFNRDHFFASLKTHGSPLPFRSAAKQREFYDRWLRSSAFGLWMARQEEAINKFLHKPA
ncbi:hypothetical protein M0805_009826 [Coniferiporia weirii]|nr:hypothetical protein M0805_009826 [Coniferiporia weirii]